MIAIRDKPILTDIYSRTEEFRPIEGSVYIYGNSGEARSDHVGEWMGGFNTARFVNIIEQSQSTITINLQETPEKYSLRSTDQLLRLWSAINSKIIYIDITGLAHHIWAPLLRSVLLTNSQVIVIYVEPENYIYSATPTEGEIFDLSERIMGISPLPGFASLSDSTDESVCFVPLLGFEGTRLAYIIEHVQPLGEKIVPIVGVPGFRIEYPFHTFQGNSSPLIQTRAWKNVRYARANCPFSLFYLLQDIAAAYPRDLLKIAPIGTKPHALGAVLYAIASSRGVELVYDHPIRKTGRSSGIAHLFAYHVSLLPIQFTNQR